MTNKITKKKRSYTICVYSKFDQAERPRTFHAENRRAVVGLMKTIMDNFNPAHVDIMSDQDFNNLSKDQTQFT